MLANRIRGVSLVISCLAAAVAGCEGSNLIGEVDDDAGSVSGSPDAGLGVSVYADAAAGVDAVPVVGGSPDAAAGMPTDAAGSQTPDAVGGVDASVGGVDASVGGCPITYPPSGFFGQNILVPQATPLTNRSTAAAYTMAANVPLGYALTIKMTVLGGTGGTSDLGPVWLLSQSDYRVTDFDRTTHEQLFMSTLPGVNEVDISFDGSGSARIDLYECGSPTPTRVETISWTM